jgi:hypothetical protein
VFMKPKRKLERAHGRAFVTIIRKGTGSERRGVILETRDGEQIVLSRLGANPFQDPETLALGGHTLEVEGYRLGSELRYVSVRVVE